MNVPHSAHAVSVARSGSPSVSPSVSTDSPASPSVSPSGPPASPSGPPASPSGHTASREAELVELVDAAGTYVGTATVLAAHEAPGMLHRAFSVFLRRPDGRVLLQQRAAVKTRFPLRWGNTCCGHPVPGEPVVISAGRRLGEELAISRVTLREVGVYVYFAEDPITGRVEREYDHVLLGDVPDGVEFRPNPEEVAKLRWVTVDTLLQEIGDSPTAYAPWLEGVTRRLAAHLGPQPSDTVIESAPEPPGGK
jgi:isopentenyl-diphosphate delta-isomerase